MKARIFFTVLCACFYLQVTNASTINGADACTVGQPETSNGYQSVKWYRDAAERNALYRQIFLLGEAQVKHVVQSENLQPHQWGVVFDVDETVFDDSEMYKNKVLNCQTMDFNLADFTQFEVQGIARATPGAVKLTCAIQKMGGYVSLVSNRDATYVDSQTGRSVMQATLDNLKNEGLCFDQVILMNKNSSSMDKNPRFQAIESGQYASAMMYSVKLPKHQILAFFGDNIQDFPNYHQAEMITENPNGKSYDPFGVIYFILPNPMYGSWQTHALQ